MPKDKTLLHDTPTAKTQPHKSDEAPKDKTLLRDTSTKIQKPDEVSRDKIHLHDTLTHKIRPHKLDEKIEVYDALYTYTHVYIN